MATQESLVYRRVVTLQDGSRILIRPLNKDDRAAYVAFFAAVESEELTYFRQNVSDTEMVGAWVDTLNYDNVFPMIALSGDRIVGTSTLHMHQGPSRHIGEVRIYLAKEVRGKGLGMRLFQAIIEIAKRRNLLILEARVIRDQVNVVRAFHNAGFTTKCVLEDAYMLPNGDLRDVDYMILRLRPVDDQF